MGFCAVAVSGFCMSFQGRVRMSAVVTFTLFHMKSIPAEQGLVITHTEQVIAPDIHTGNIFSIFPWPFTPLSLLLSESDFHVINLFLLPLLSSCLSFCRLSVVQLCALKMEPHPYTYPRLQKKSPGACARF